MNRSRLQHLLGAMSLSLLAACGGGGGDAPAAAAPTPSLALVAGSMGSNDRVGGSGSADGIGAGARFNTPWGVATDSAGNVYVADSENHTIRKITPAGAVTTVVGVAGQSGFAPGALPGLLPTPHGVAVNGTSLYMSALDGVAVVTHRP
jgi:NHL repeat